MDLYNSFFTNEGASLPDARRLYSQAIRSVSAQAYWSAVARLFKGEVKTSVELSKFVLAHHPSMAVVPPVGQLFRDDSSVTRAAMVLANGLGRSQSSVKGQSAN